MVEDLGPRNAQVARLRKLLSDRATRRDAGVFVAEGVRCIDGLFDRHANVRALYIDADAHERSGELRVRAEAAAIPVMQLASGVGRRLGATVTSQAVFAEVAAHIAALDDVSFWGITPVVVLVDVQDPGNVGTILRAAEAAGVSTIVAVGDTVDCWNPKVVRASAGALGGLTLVEAREPQPALDTLRANGFVTVSTVVRGGQAPDVVDLAGPIALVVGSEAHGLDPDVAHACDLHVTIPMTGASESLNAAVATSVLLFEAARQRRWDQA